MVRFLVHQGYPEVEVERTRSPSRQRPKPGKAVPVSFERRQSPPRRNRSPNIVSIRGKSTNQLDLEHRQKPPRNASAQRSVYSTPDRDNLQQQRLVTNHRNSRSPSPSRRRLSKHLVPTERTKPDNLARQTDSSARRPIPPPDFPSKRENLPQSRWSTKQTDRMLQRDSAHISIIQRSVIDSDDAVLQESNVQKDLSGTTESFSKNEFKYKNQKLKQNEERKNIFRRDRAQLDERNDNYLDARDDLPSLVDECSPKIKTQKKVPMWRRRWKRKKKNSVSSKEELSSVGKKSIDFGRIMKKLEIRRKEKCGVDIAPESEIPKDRSAKESLLLNQHDFTLNGNDKRKEDCKHPTSQDLEHIFCENAEPAFPLPPSTERKDSQQRVNKVMTEYQRESSMFELAASPEEQWHDRRMETIPSEQSCWDYRQMPSKKIGNELDTTLFRKEKRVSQGGDIERDSHFPQSDYQILRDESRNVPYSAPSQEIPSEKRGMLELTSCYRDTTTLPLQLSSVNSSIKKKLRLPERKFPVKNVRNLNREREAPVETFQTDEKSTCQDAIDGSKSIQAIPSWHRDEDGLPLQHSSLENDINKKLDPFTTSHENKVRDQYQEFGAPMQKISQTDERTKCQGAAYEKGGILAMTSCYRNIASLPDINKKVDLSIASHAKKDGHQVLEATVQTNFETDKIPNDEDANNGNKSILALLSCHQDTTSLPMQYPVESGTREKLKSREMLNNLYDLSGGNKDEVMKNRDEQSFTVKSPRSMGLLLQPNCSGFDTELAIPRHKLLSFASFSHASGDTASAPVTSQIPSTLAKGLGWMYGGPIAKELLRNFKGAEGIDGEEESDMELSLDASISSSESMKVSKFIETTEMAANGIRSDISSFSSSYFSSQANSQETMSSSEENNEIGRNFVDSVDTDRLRQIARELQIDPAELIRRLEAGEDIDSLIRRELSIRFCRAEEGGGPRQLRKIS